MIVLSIDASTQGCSVAVFENDSLLASFESNVERSSAESLTNMIKHVLQISKVEFAQLDAIGVAKGPGSYTGLRIAVSTAKGLCVGLDKPLLSYGTLEGMLHQVPDLPLDSYLLCPMIDARRMEVFSGIYQKDNFQVVEEVSANIIEPESFTEILAQNKIVFFGEGSAKCKTTLTHSNAVFYGENISPGAKFSGKILYEKYKNGEFEDLVTFEPFYLKEYMFKTKKP
jgi:tRNA threonylcarbamoyladenosine biosynthesis protein TsaB